VAAAAAVAVAVAVAVDAALCGNRVVGGEKRNSLHSVCFWSFACSSCFSVGASSKFEYLILNAIFFDWSEKLLLLLFLLLCSFVLLIHELI
jgi:hypothetical protein